MQELYWKYYKNRNRGFIDAEFQQTCEEIAGASLAQEFEYVNTTREIDYSKYLGYAGLKLGELATSGSDNKQAKRFSISRIENPNALQLSILTSWQNEK